MDINAIKQLIQMIKESGLSAVEVEENGARIRLENSNFNMSSGTGAPVTNIDVLQSSEFTGSLHSVSVPPSAEAASVNTEPESDFVFAKAPMVGVFCSLSKLGRKDLVPGDAVSPETIVYGLEAMKMVCDVESEVSGIYVETIVKEGDQVEYGQPIMKFKKA